MKLAVIIGVIHMTFGICLKGWNAIYFREYLDFFFEFIPQIIFMQFIFGFMIYLIFIKWLTFYPDSSDAPGIISMLVRNPLNWIIGGEKAVPFEELSSIE